MDYNKHHLIQKRMKEYYNIDDERNIKKILVKSHEALHTLFEDYYTPKGQILYMKDLFHTVLSDKVLQSLEWILSLPEEEFYDNGLVKRSLIYNRKKGNIIHI